VRTCGTGELVGVGLSVGAGLFEEVDVESLGEGLELGLGDELGLELGTVDGLGDGAGLGSGDGTEAPSASKALYAFTRPFCTFTVDPPCVRAGDWVGAR
jgi:hypothetical protein